MRRRIAAWLGVKHFLNSAPVDILVVTHFIKKIIPDLKKAGTVDWTPIGGCSQENTVPIRSSFCPQTSKTMPIGAFCRIPLSPRWALILLGVNRGLANNDVANLPLSGRYRIAFWHNVPGPILRHCCDDLLVLARVITHALPASAIPRDKKYGGEVNTPGKRDIIFQPA